MALTTVRIIIFGNVQKHAFRKHIREIATGPEFRLVGYVQNLKDYDRSVEIVCQGSEDKITLFIKKLESLKYDNDFTNSRLVRIDDVKPSLDKEHSVTYHDFDIIRGDDEAGERFDDGIEQLTKLRSETTAKALIEDKQQMRELADKIIKTQEILTQYITSKK